MKKFKSFVYKTFAAVLGIATLVLFSVLGDDHKVKKTTEKRGSPLSRLSNGIHEKDFGDKTCVVVKDEGITSGFAVALECKNSKGFETKTKTFLRGSFLAALSDGESTLKFKLKDGVERLCTIEKDSSLAAGYAISTGCTPSIYK